MPEMPPIPVRLTERTAKRLTSEQFEEVRRRLADRHPDSDFNAAEAAIYTGRSTKTLKRAIDAGVGPVRSKNPDATGLGATNRHTRYRKSDLDAWRTGLVAFGLDFRQFDDLVLDAPWVFDRGYIVGHLLDILNVDHILEALKEGRVVFLRLDEALLRRWVHADRKQSYYEQLVDITERTVLEAKAAVDRDYLDANTV